MGIIEPTDMFDTSALGGLIDTEHTLLAMRRNTAVEEGWVGGVDNLSESEAFVLDT